MARIPDELRATFYDGSVNDIKKPNIKGNNNQPIFIDQVIDKSIITSEASLLNTNIKERENVFAKIKKCIFKRKSHN